MSRETSPNPPTAKSYYTVCVLTLLYSFSYLDRQLPSLLLQSIKADLHLTDVEVSLLTGLSFAIFYCVSALPLSAIADRWSRKGVIGGGLLLWGSATAMCGAAGSFFQFFVARMGVGLGESALTPTSYSLIADLFPAGRRARPMAIFNLGMVIGTGLAMLAGAGAIGLAEALRVMMPTLFGGVAVWKLVLSGTGLLTLALIPLVLSISDPRRVSADATPRISFRMVFLLIWRERRAYLPILLGFPILNMAAYGFNAWAPTFFIRSHGWSAAQTGVALGVSGIIGGLVGAFLGGWLADRLIRRSPIAPLLISVAAALVCTLATMLLCVASVPGVQLMLTLVQQIFTVPIGIIGAVCLQEIAPPSARARISAIYILIAGLVGVGLGPTLIGALTDFVLHSENAIGQSMALAWLIALSLSALVILPNGREFARAATARAAVR